jgi:hypothetical protein
MDNINLPKSWEEVYADQFIALKLIDDSEKGFYWRKIEILSILTDTLATDDIWEDIDVDEMSELIKSISWIKNEPNSYFSKKIGDFTYRGVNVITLGEFIHLDHCIVNGLYTNLYEICSILYRRSRLDDWGNVEFEPYGKIDFELRKKLFEDLELKITDIYGVVDEFLEFKKLITESYSNLFNGPDPEEEDDDSQFTEEELEIIRKEEAREAEQRQWSWENIIRGLANDDITKFDSITDLPLIFVLNQLSYIKTFVNKD